MNQNNVPLKSEYLPVRKILVLKTDSMEPVIAKHRGEPESLRVFVTMNAGETRVTIVNIEDECEGRWTAVFGWAVLFRIPLVVEQRNVFLEDLDLVCEALSGSAKIFGQSITTEPYRLAAVDQFRSAIDDILSKTIGSIARYPIVVLSCPGWLRETVEMSSCHIQNLTCDTLEE